MLFAAEQMNMDIVLLLSMTLSQVTKAKAYVRKELGIVVETKVPDYDWVRQHQYELENLERKKFKRFIKSRKDRLITVVISLKS